MVSTGRVRAHDAGCLAPVSASRRRRLDVRTGHVVACASADAGPGTPPRLLCALLPRAVPPRRARPHSGGVGARVAGALPAPPHVAAERLFPLHADRGARLHGRPARTARLSVLRASVELSIASPESASLDDVFRLQRALLACAQGEAVDAAWAGTCRPVMFLQLVRDLLTLLVSVDADGRTVLAEYLPDSRMGVPAVVSPGRSTLGVVFYR
jgi:hypothetical protein